MKCLHFQEMEVNHLAKEKPGEAMALVQGYFTEATFKFTSRFISANQLQKYP